MMWRKCCLLSLLLLLVLSGSSCQYCDRAREEQSAKAREMAHRTLIVDTHVDTPYRLIEKTEDISLRTESGDFDYPRAIEGGLDAAFMSIFTSPSQEEEGTAKRKANDLIDGVERLAEEHSDKFFLASSVQEVTDLTGQGRIALAFGMENGAPIEGSLRNLRHFYERGIRYITLAHAKANHISDSSYDEKRRWNGLSPFGRELVAEMNRLGVMVDISHVSDEAFYQVMEISTAPVIASHSSCRHFTPGFERNMSDDMIRLLAEKGGVIQISFSSWFISEEYRQKGMLAEEEIKRQLEPLGIEFDSKEGWEFRKEYSREHPIPVADVSEVADHIQHVIELVGVDHVGLGSDFDGAGPTMPNGLRDVSDFPNLIFELLDRGYSEDEIEKICSGNLLRVWSEVERVAGEGKQ
jgi:membrane dipeptidase